jgi:E3 ubiquitin-protein ligase UBR2
MFTVIFLNIHLFNFQVKNACIPFLRCCALFYHFLVGVPGPNVLMEVGGDTFENLCAYLGLPNSYHELMSLSAVFDLSVKWAQHEKVRIPFVLILSLVKVQWSENFKLLLL